MHRPIRFRSSTDETLYVASTNGHSARIGADWRELPTCLHAEAIAAGAITNNMDDATAALQVAKVVPEPAQAGDDPAELIRSGIIRLLETDDEDAMTKAGVPNLSKLSAEVGFNVDREQMLAVWREMESTADAGA